uniref:Uncharacterized protein n=1 Tax=Megaviridae environmental sample TaxID=1737588 RepID=A0A5J6VJ47_9VIRU|nr:MAG: hypothetical protein [Megaviridae environmental sample]
MNKIEIILILFMGISIISIPRYTPVKTSVKCPIRANKKRYLIYAFFYNLFKKITYEFYILQILNLLNLKWLFYKQDKLYITPLYQRTFGLESNKIHWVDYEKRISGSKNYMSLFLESDYLLRKNQTIITPSIANLEQSLIDIVLTSPLFWQFDPTKENIYNVKIDMEKFSYFTWAHYDCQEIECTPADMNELSRNPNKWMISIKTERFSTTTNQNPTDEHLYNLQQAISTIAWLIPGGWHSWVHFPYADFSSAWVCHQQDNNNTDGVFYKIMYQHTINTKFNTIAVKSGNSSTHTDFDAKSRTSPSTSAFPVQSRELLNIIMDYSADFQNTLKHPILSSSVKSPFIDIYRKAWMAFQVFIDSIWDKIEEQAMDFIEYIHMNSKGKLDFRTNAKEFIIRVLASAGAFHAFDHLSMSVSFCKNPVARSMYEANISPEYPDQEWAKEQIHHNAKRYKNFIMTFVVYSPTGDTVNYKNLDYMCKDIQTQQDTLKTTMTNIIKDLNNFYINMGFSDILTDGEILVENISASIDH